MDRTKIDDAGLFEKIEAELKNNPDSFDDVLPTSLYIAPGEIVDTYNFLQRHQDRYGKVSPIFNPESGAMDLRTNLNSLKRLIGDYNKGVPQLKAVQALSCHRGVGTLCIVSKKYA